MDELSLDSVDRRIINGLQRGLPVCERPYAAAAAELDIEESELLARLQRLLADGTLSRFGPMYNAERMGGAFTLAALAVPEQDLDQVAALVNAFPEVAHNYLREHPLNMWFVLATEDPAGIDAVVREIEGRTGLTVWQFPKLREFFVGLYLEV